LNITITDEEISIVHPWGAFSEAEADRDEETLTLGQEPWSCIQVGDRPLGFEECGIVSSQSATLSEHGVAIFYMCTFSFDYVLVSQRDVDTAIPALSSKFKLDKSMTVSCGNLETIEESPAPPARWFKVEDEGSGVEAETLKLTTSNNSTCSSDVKEEIAQEEVDSHADAAINIGGDANTDAQFEIDYA